MDRNNLLNELSWFARPLFEAIEDKDSAISFFNEFGYELHPSDVDNIFAGFEKLANSISLIINEDSGNEEEADVINEDLIEFFKAIKSLANDDTIKSYFSLDFFNEIFDYLLFHYLATKNPFLFSLCHALGVIEQNEIDQIVRGLSYTQIVFHWSRFDEFINDNSKWAKEVYGWKGDPNAGDEKALDYELLLNTLSLILESAGLSLIFPRELSQSELNDFISNNTDGKSFFGASMPLLQEGNDEIDENGPPVFSKEAGIKILPYGDLDQSQNLGFAVTPYARGNIDGEHELDDNLVLTAKISSEAQAGVYITITPGGISTQAGGNVNASFLLEIKYADRLENKPVTLLSVGEKSGLKSNAVKIGIGGNISGDFYVSGGVEKLNAVIDFGNDGLLSNFFEQPVEILAGDINAKWQHNGGISFEGGNNVAIILPVHISAGPMEINQIGLELRLQDDSEVIFDVSGKLSLGPVNISVSNIGMKAAIEEKENGLLGNYDLDFTFKPPNGVGLAIDAGAAKGGGYLFFDYERQKYAGAMELTIAEFISAKAVGLITTRMPDGSSGFSMLVIVTAEFTPPFQLGFGFTLNGVGGLLGLNRTVLLDPLRDGVRTGAVNNMMFPDNVVENAPRIISDLKTVFPTYEDKFLIGPMGKMGWGNPTLITLSMGLVIEIPGNIAILGVMKVALPEERKPLVQIQVAFVGTLDFDKKKLTFDASLYESFILHMTLEGDMAVRLRWGDPPVFILSVGGFHPSFEPPPVSLPTLRRLSISILNRSNAKIRIECYQAVTSNTVQFGAKAELYFDLSACSINGHIGFDALFQFSPFYFITELSSNFDLKALGRDVMSVKIKMSLEGTTPWNAQGTGSVSVLFFSITADFDRTWGDKEDTSLPDIEILPQLLDAFNDPAQWSADLASGNNLLVALRELDQSESSKLILHPYGSLQVQQKLMPLSVNIEKVGNKQTSDIKKAVVTGAYSKDAQGSEISLEISDAKDSFARAQFQELSDAERLSKPSFEKMPAGVKVSMGNSTINNGTMVRRKVEYQQTIIDQVPEKPLKFGQFYAEIEALFTGSLKGNSISKSKLSKKYEAQLQPFDDKLAIEDEGFAVAYQSDNKAFNGTATFSSQIMAETYLEEETSKNPALKKQLHIIPNYELQQ